MAAVLTYLPNLISGVGFLYADALVGYLPVYHEAFYDVPHGSPFWSPLQGLGHPILAAGEVPVFYPPIILLHLILGYHGMQAILLPAHSLLASWFAYRLALTQGTSRISSLLAGVAYSQSLWMVGHIVHPTFGWAAAWLPAILLSALATIRGPRISLLFPLAVAATLTLGAPQIANVNAMVAFIFSAHFLLVHTSGWSRFRGAIRLGAGAGLGLAMALPAILPSLLHLQESFRSSALPVGTILEMSYPPRQLLTLLSPFALGNPTPGVAADPLVYFGGANFHELSAYVGILSIGFSFLGVSTRSRLKQNWPLVLAIATAFLVSSGRYTPLGPILARVPWLDRFRVWPRFLLPATLALSLLAARGFDYFLETGEGGVRKLAWFGVVTAGLLLGTFVLVRLARPALVAAAQDWVRAHVLGQPGRLASAEYYLAWPGALLDTLVGSIPRPTILIAVTSSCALLLRRSRLPWVVLALTWLDLASALWLYAPVRLPPSSPPIVAELHTRGVRTIFPLPRESVNDLGTWRTLGPTTYVLYGFSSPTMNSSLGLARVRSVLSGVSVSTEDNGVRRLDKDAVATLRFLGVDAITFDAEEGPLEVEGASTEVLPDRSGFSLLGSPGRFAWLARRIETLPPRGFEPHGVSLTEDVISGETVLLDSQIAGVPSSGPLEGDVNVLQADPDRLVLGVVASRPAILVVRGAFALGWKAFINTIEVPVIPADACFRGIAVPSGQSRVVLTFAPRGLQLGVWLSIVAIAGWIVLAIVSLRSKTELAPSQAPISDHPSKS